jgi:ATPase subunit of ABC transporter with duplicated ATPase domains
VKGYPGTVVFVSHDRWFVSELATRIVEITADGLRDFPGTYPAYLEKCGDDHLDGEAVVLKAKRERKEATTTGGGLGSAAPGGESWQDWEVQKRRRNRIAQLPKLRDKALADIEAAEARKREIQDLYYKPDFYLRTSNDVIAALQTEDATLTATIETLMATWEELEKELAAASGVSGADA